jgi:hypothetical protein
MIRDLLLHFILILLLFVFLLTIVRSHVSATILFFLFLDFCANFSMISLNLFYFYFSAFILASFSLNNIESEVRCQVEQEAWVISSTNYFFLVPLSVTFYCISNPPWWVVSPNYLSGVGFLIMVEYLH